MSGSPKMAKSASHEGDWRHVPAADILPDTDMGEHREATEAIRLGIIRKSTAWNHAGWFPENDG